jgi:hypothetical protein
MIERAATEEGMSKHYATSDKFGGQRASVARNVCVKHQSEIFVGVVVAISIDGRRPIIRMLTDLAANGARDSAFGFHDGDLPFADVKSEADVDAAPEPCWFWPPRV